MVIRQPLAQSITWWTASWRQAPAEIVSIELIARPLESRLAI